MATPTADPGAASRADLLTAVTADTGRIAELEARRLVVIAALCDAYSGIDTPTPGVLHGEQLVFPGADGTPEVTEFFHLELSIALGCSAETAQVWVADTLNLRHRHPILWNHTIHTRVPVWVARQVSRTSLGLTLDQARRFDAAWAALMTGWTPGKIFHHTEQEVARLLADEDKRRVALDHREVRFTPTSTAGITHLDATLDSIDAAHLDATLNKVADVLALGGSSTPRAALRSEALGHLAHPDRARTLLTPTLLDQGGAVTPDGLVVDAQGEVRTPDQQACHHGVELVLHLRPDHLATDASSLGETLEGRALGAFTRTHLNQLLAGVTGGVIVRPVIDLAAPSSIGVYRPSEELRWRVTLRDQRVLFPYSNRSARGRGIDLDHTVPWPDGPTSTTNLAPLTRTMHRAKTHGGYTVEQTSPGVLHWRTPTGQHVWTSTHGTWKESAAGTDSGSSTNGRDWRRGESPAAGRDRRDGSPGPRLVDHHSTAVTGRIDHLLRQAIHQTAEAEAADPQQAATARATRQNKRRRPRPLAAGTPASGPPTPEQPECTGPDPWIPTAHPPPF